MDNAVLLDTNAVSILLKEASVHAARRTALENLLRGKFGFISFVTVAELLFWAEKRKWGQGKRDALDGKIRSLGILDPTRDTADIWARTRASCEDAGQVVQHHDLWIAAAALEHGLPLVSFDDDFDCIPGLQRIKF
jgi:predicted nucleic acid-binding protein